MDEESSEGYKSPFTRKNKSTPIHDGEDVYDDELSFYGERQRVPTYKKNYY